MEVEILAQGASGVIAGFFAGSVAEWPIHKYILHNPRATLPFIQHATKSHHWNHHPAYEPNQHYFGDGTNEQAVTHFSKKDITLIMGLATSIGAVCSQIPSLVKGKLQMRIPEAAFTGGFLVGAATYYTIYETTHHLMHTLNERRQKMWYTLGDAIQGNQPDDRLRLSIPLLETIAQEAKTGNYAQTTYTKLAYQLNVNRARKEAQRPHIILTEEEIPGLLQNLPRESTREKSWSKQFKEYVIEQVQSSPTFQAMARHHYMHHIADHTNLNVVFPGPDWIMGTKITSTSQVLDAKPTLWHLPNPTARRIPVRA
ncbi:hypothetical protein EXS73_02325 [Candidatus Pacearchaeota archaeon]|nr:hypothetical protein [Candidatus Pacearchaeota archaeon]